MPIAKQFAGKEVHTSYGDSRSYKPKTITEQVGILRKYWPELNANRAIRYAQEVYPALSLPEWIDGPFAIIRPGFFSRVYEAEAKEILKAVSAAFKGNFYNHDEDQFSKHYLRRNTHTTKMLRVLCKEQQGDILVVGGQLGSRYRGRSVDVVREMFSKNEFGLDICAGGCALLTHPERLVSTRDLMIDCPGSEFRFDDFGEFACAPAFSFKAGWVWLSSNGCRSAHKRYGSTSAFVSQR